MTLDGAVGGDGGDGDPEGEAHRATAETLPEGQAQDISDLSHGDRGSRHRLFLEQQFGAGWPGYLTSRQRYAEGLSGVHENTGTGARKDRNRCTESSGIRRDPDLAKAPPWRVGPRGVGLLLATAGDFPGPQRGRHLAPTGYISMATDRGVGRAAMGLPLAGAGR